ncbi:Na+/H+ antiporter subunit E [Pseudohaliea sp.]|uniref:Na+/H+ antiporter subunit E n=1 Tax=Pseudohaliea sp. TaxID=2740289 RepID=UPI0032ECABE3
MPAVSSAVFLRAGAFRAVLYALLWGVLAGFEPGSWSLGVPAVLLATWLSLRLLPPVGFRLLPVLSFLGYFAWHSLLGAVDVARRALAPRLRLAPALVPFDTALPPGLPRVLLLNSISLTPGTLSADIRDDTVWVHVLDKAGGHEAALAGLEARLARVFSP